MSQSESNERLDRARRMMMAALDGELSTEEVGELDRLVESDPALQAEWHRLKQVKEATKTMTLRAPPDEVWDGYWNTVYRRLERGIGWILASIGAIVLLSYGTWMWVRELLADTSLPWFIKGAILALVVGLVIVFVSVIREKLFVRKTDPYKDVVR